jgi:hypothetical protein
MALWPRFLMDAIAAGFFLLDRKKKNGTILTV